MSLSSVLSRSERKVRELLPFLLNLLRVFRRQSEKLPVKWVMVILIVPFSTNPLVWVTLLVVNNTQLLVIIGICKCTVNIPYSDLEYWLDKSSALWENQNSSLSSGRAALFKQSFSGTKYGRNLSTIWTIPVG